jgi:hypothetical protein
MNPNNPDAPDTFLHNEAFNTWADFERIHYLRQLARNSQERLTVLYQHPYRNAERIACEQITLELIQKELQELQPPNHIY